jgi:sialate O-acetylesterase
MTFNLDLGEWNDLHLLNKKNVAHILYLASYKPAYGENMVYIGPELKKLTKKEDRLILEFSNLAGV